MANGPPTPPPTTAIELEDAARSSATASVAASTSTTIIPSNTHQDLYQRTLPTIANLAAQNKYHEIVQLAEHSDLDGDHDRQHTRFLVTAPLVLSYLIVNNLPPARFALARLPDNLASHPLARSLLDLLAATWMRKYDKVYSRAEILFHQVGRSEFFQANLGTLITTMVTTFVESFRQRMFALLRKAYTSVSLETARTYLGLSVDQLLLAAERNAWTYDKATRILHLATTSLPKSSDTFLSGPSSLNTFDLVTASVAKLEV